LLALGDPALWGLAIDLVEHFSKQTPEPELEWRRLVVEFTRSTPSGTVEDKAHITFDLMNVTGGSLDTSWTGADFVACEGFLDQWWTTVKPFVSSTHSITAYRWYRMKFADTMTVKNRFALTGPPVRVQTKSMPGTDSATVLPYQIALSVTEKTCVPKHWGRFYLPGLTPGAMTTTNGRWASAVVTAIANATAELYEDWFQADFQPVVPVTQWDKVLQGGLLTVEKLQVDDIPDVIRRRRPRQPTIRAIGVPS